MDANVEVDEVPVFITGVKAFKQDKGLLTRNQVIAIYRDKIPAKVAARKYNVSTHAVYKIKSKTNYARYLYNEK
jgi:DNA invertase Pin-like site-specific DNA recombinase